MLTKIQTYIIVTIFTGLIWLYAEGENVRLHELEMYIQFVSPPGKELVIEPDEQWVSVTIKCATSQLARVQNLIARGIRLELHEDENGSPYQDVALLGRLGRYRPLTDLGVTVVDVSHPVLRVRVEAMDTRRVPVMGVVEGDVQLASPPVTDISEVAVRLPASGAQLITDQTRVEARVRAQDVENLDVNVQHTFEVPLTLPSELRSPHVSMSANSAKVSFRIRDMRESYTIPIIPVYVTGPPAELSRYHVQFAEESRVLRDVQVMGPSDVIDRIRRRQAVVYAELLLTPDELERYLNTTQSSHVFVRLPSGVTVVSTPAPVTFQVFAAQ